MFIGQDKFTNYIKVLMQSHNLMLTDVHFSKQYEPWRKAKSSIRKWVTDDKVENVKLRQGK